MVWGGRENGYSFTIYSTRSDVFLVLNGSYKFGVK